MNDSGVFVQAGNDAITAADTVTNIANTVDTGKSSDLIGLPTLMKLAFNNGDLASVAENLLARIQANAYDANALMDMAVFLILRGSPDIAMNMKSLAINTQQLYHYKTEGVDDAGLAEPVKPIRLLAILGPGDLMANSPIEFLLEGSRISLDMLYITPKLGVPDTLPEHDAVIVAIGESDLNQALLAQLDHHLQNWPVPVMNRASRIARLSRDASYALLANLPGISMPPTVRMPRLLVEQLAEQLTEQFCQSTAPNTLLAEQLNGAGFPIIIRPIDSHAGQGLSRIDHAAELVAYLAESTESEFFVSPFVDYRSSDGQFRKYRIILINGIAFACHMAVSGRWMVHYLNADMLDNADNRAEEAEFMRDFDSQFAIRHATAMASISSQLELDYVGIDCAETPDGKLLIFEVDSNMIVHNMDSPIKFPYKQGAMHKLFAGFATMVKQRIEAGCTPQS